MKTVDTILYNAIVLTMDQAFKSFEPGAIAINNSEIEAVGENDAILSAYTAEQRIDCGLKVVMPGFINAHTHVPMNLLRGLADDLRLDVWLMGYMMPVEREFVTPEFVYLGTQLACAEMIRSGITTFADMYYFEDQVAEAAAQVGMRALPAQTIMKYPAPDASSFDQSLRLGEDLIQKWKNHPLITPTLAPHSVYTSTPDILKSCTELALKYDIPIHIHISETADEVESAREDFGMPVVPYLRKLGVLEAKIIGAHCVHIDEGEMRSLSKVNAGVAHNPSSNLKLASGFAPVNRMLELGLNVGIGTDGTASNNDLDMLEEIRLASFIAKAITGDPTALPAKQTLSMATLTGAKALHIDNLTGSLEPGKKADLIVIDIYPLHNSPRFKRDSDTVYAQVLYASKSTDITDVMVNGNWLMRDKQIPTIDEPMLLKEANKIAKQIDTFLIKREKSVLSKLVAIGGAMEEESLEIQSKVHVENPQDVIKKIHDDPSIKIVRIRHYHEFDTYFFFEDTNQGTLRYREDEFLDEKERVTNVRSRLTLIGETREGTLPQDVMLSRSRYYAPASHSLRFYREYFQPKQELEIEKKRKRYLITYQGFDFFINIDTILNPDLGAFVEIKSRTWSRQDAEEKSKVLNQLLSYLSLSPDNAETRDYFMIVQKYNKEKE